MSVLLTKDQQFISQLTEIILENLRDENFGVKELSDLSGMGQSALNHRLHSIVKKNINEFVREVRLQRAYEILQNDALTAAEVAYKVGFSSPSYFNKCFHELYGYPPGKVEKKVSDSHESGNLASHISQLSEKRSSILSSNAIINSILILAIIILLMAILIYVKISIK
jgi:AraC-like DNA-binding protein